MVVLLAGLLEETATALRDGVVTAVPWAILAVLFALLAYVGIRVVLSFSVGSSLGCSPTDRSWSSSCPSRSSVSSCVVRMALAILKIPGLGEVAASLGTAVGFVALGVSYALSR